MGKDTIYNIVTIDLNKRIVCARFMTCAYFKSTMKNWLKFTIEKALFKRVFNKNSEIVSLIRT